MNVRDAIATTEAGPKSSDALDLLEYDGAETAALVRAAVHVPDKDLVPYTSPQILSVPETPRHLGIQEKLHYAEVLARASVLPKSYRDNPANVLLAIEYAELLGVHPMTALTKIHVIEGTPSMAAELMRAQVKKAGHRFRIVAWTSERAEIEITLTYDAEFPVRAEFTIDDAKSANLVHKDNWKKYPKDMLLARATSRGVRAACPEVLHGISYVPDELGAIVDQDGNVLDVGETTTAPPDIVYPTEDNYDAMKARVAEMTPSELAELREWRLAQGISLRPHEFSVENWQAVMDKSAEIMNRNDENDANNKPPADPDTGEILNGEPFE